MATYYSSYSNEYRLRLVITQGTQNVTNNTSVVSWTLFLHSGNKNMSVYSTYHATVNGVSAPNTTQTNVSIGYNSAVTLGSGSTTVTHNADGTKSVAFSASFKTNSPAYAGGVLITPGTMTISGTFPLTTIPRYATITAFSTAISDRSAYLGWASDKTISEWRWSTNSGSSYSAWITVNAKSDDISVSVSPGSTYGLRVQVKNSASGLITTSSVVSKTATKTPSTLSFNTTSQNVGSGITWTIDPSYDYTHKMTYFFGNTSGWILGNDSTQSSTLTGTWTLPTALANQIPTATSGSGTIYLITYYGGVRVGEKAYTFTAKVPNNTTWQPSVPTVTISEAATTGMTSYVQGKSKANVVSSSTAQGGASIKSYRVIVSDIGTYYGADITSGYFTKSGTFTITVRATDSRGYYREKSNTITVVAYSPPKLTAYTASRSPNEQGTNLATSINFSVASIDNQNTKQYRIRYRPTGGTWVTLVNSGEYYTRSTTHSATGVLDANKSYEVEFYVADWYSSVTQVKNIGTAFQLMDFNASGRGMAIGKVSEKNAFEVALPAEFTKGIAFLDTRAALATPESLPGQAISFEFKSNSSVGNPPVTASPTYSHIINVAGWNSNEGSGGWPSQISVGASGLAVRQATSATSWGSWVTAVDYGSNTNGSYVKFSDGTMICTASRVINETVNTQGIFTRTWVYPAKFYGLPAKSIIGGYGASSHTTNVSINTSSSVDSDTSCVIIMENPYNGAAVMRADATAIGRWK